MDTASRRLVIIIAIFTVIVMAVMAGTFYSDSKEQVNTAAVEPPQPLNDAAEAANSGEQGQQAASEFSTDIPTREEIPAIDGTPSMTFDNTQNNNNNVAKESTKGIPGNSQ